jgi:hypothetical protein
MNHDQYRLVADILAGALEDLECEIDEHATDEYNRTMVRQASLLRPLVEAIAANDAALTDEERQS